MNQEALATAVKELQKKILERIASTSNESEGDGNLTPNAKVEIMRVFLRLHSQFEYALGEPEKWQHICNAHSHLILENIDSMSSEDISAFDNELCFGLGLDEKKHLQLQAATIARGVKIEEWFSNHQPAELPREEYFTGEGKGAWSLPAARALAAQDTFEAELDRLLSDKTQAELDVIRMLVSAKRLKTYDVCDEWLERFKSDFQNYFQPRLIEELGEARSNFIEKIAHLCDLLDQNGLKIEAEKALVDAIIDCDFRVGSLDLSPFLPLFGVGVLDAKWAKEALAQGDLERADENGVLPSLKNQVLSRLGFDEI